MLGFARDDRRDGAQTIPDRDPSLRSGQALRCAQDDKTGAGCLASLGMTGGTEPGRYPTEILRCAQDDKRRRILRFAQDDKMGGCLASLRMTSGAQGERWRSPLM